jgi:hypothetical protein
MSELPKRFRPIPLTKEELARLRKWVKDTGWTRQKTINREFDIGTGSDRASMPRVLWADVPMEDWERKGKCVCVMCGRTSMATNICRECPEMPADVEHPNPPFCRKHKTYHYIIKNGKKVGAVHRSIHMVAVS